MAYLLKAGKETISIPRISTLVVEMVSPWNKHAGPTRIETRVMKEAHKDLPVRVVDYGRYRNTRVGMDRLCERVDALDFVIARRFIRYVAENGLVVTRIN
ncbi:hypothetical protein D3C71_77590 [compost metagenome]